jgi:hypothetical protein
MSSIWKERRMPLKPGDPAPDWKLLAVVDGKTVEVTRASLLEGHSSLVVTTYPLDFSGG